MFAGGRNIPLPESPSVDTFLLPFFPPPQKKNNTENNTSPINTFPPNSPPTKQHQQESNTCPLIPPKNNHREYLEERGDKEVKVGAWTPREEQDAYSGESFHRVRDVLYSRVSGCGG